MRTFSNFAYAIGLLMMVPVPGTQTVPAPDETGKMVSLATSTFSDVGYFCSRKPDLCKAVAEFALSIEANAKSGVSLIHSWASETVEFKYLSLTPSVAVLVANRAPARDLRSTLDD